MVSTETIPSQSFSCIFVPTYLLIPSADHALAQKNSFRYFERLTNKLTVASGASFTWTVSYDIANPKRLTMQAVIDNPTVGATTTSPFALKIIQVTVEDVPTLLVLGMFCSC